MKINRLLKNLQNNWNWKLNNTKCTLKNMKINIRKKYKNQQINQIYNKNNYYKKIKILNNQENS